MAVTKIKSAESNSKGCIEKDFYLNAIGCIGWSKFTDKEQLPVPEVIFQ
jgi:hypothetical protein